MKVYTYENIYVHRNSTDILFNLSIGLFSLNYMAYQIFKCDLKTLEIDKTIFLYRYQCDLSYSKDTMMPFLCRPEVLSGLQ